MLTLVDDVYENMNKDLRKQGGRNAVNIAFFDVSQMSAGVQAIYMLGFMVLMAIVVYTFYTKLVQKQEDEKAKRQAVRDAKKEKKSKRA